MATDRSGTGFLKDLIRLGEEIGLSARQIVLVAAWARRQETETINIAIELVTEQD